jgi:hypothetical protein
VGNPDDIAIVVSPMRRTLQTAMLSMDWLVERGVKIEGNADWQGIFLSRSKHQTCYKSYL